MLVSAISANNTSYLSKTLAQSNNFVNSRGSDNPVDTACNFSTSFSNLNKKGLYDSINSWKHFCQNQIAKGNIDFIA